MKRNRKSKKPNLLLFRPPLWYPLWALEEPKKRKKSKEKLSEYERDKAKEGKEHKAAQKETHFSILRAAHTPLHQEIRQREHMRLNRKVQAQPDLFPFKRPLHAPQPNRIVGERYNPMEKPFLPLQERIAQRAARRAYFEEKLK